MKVKAKKLKLKKSVKKAIVVIVAILISIGFISNSKTVSNKDEQVFANLQDKYSNTQDEADVQEDIVTEEDITEPEVQVDVPTNYVPRRAISDDALAMEKKIWNVLKKHGLSDIQAAATIGNMYVESAGLDPSAVEKDTGVGIGLIQWSNSRRTNLENYAKSQGKSWKDFDLQMEFFFKELNSSEFNAKEKASFDNPYSVESATRDFCFGFERPNVKYSHIDERIDRAWDAYYRNSTEAK